MARSVRRRLVWPTSYPRKISCRRAARLFLLFVLSCPWHWRPPSGDSARPSRLRLVSNPDSENQLAEMRLFDSSKRVEQQTAIFSPHPISTRRSSHAVIHHRLEASLAAARFSNAAAGWRGYLRATVETYRCIRNSDARLIAAPRLLGHAFPRLPTTKIDTSAASKFWPESIVCASEMYAVG